MPAITYTIKPERQDAYAEWTGSLIEKKSALSVDGIALTTPTFRGRIRSVGRISGSMDREKAEALVQALRASGGAGDEQLRVAIRLTLAYPDDPDVALAHAYRLRHDPDERQRLSAAAALGRCGGRAAAAVPDLIDALGDDSARVRAEAITALGQIGPAARAAIPSLEPLTGEDDQQIAERARAALRQIRRD